MNQRLFMRLVIIFLISLVMLLTNSRDSNADGLPFNKVATPEDILSILASVSGPAIAKTKVVFIPGILGSKLQKPKSSELVWGGTDFNNPDLFYNGTTKLIPSTFDQLSIDLIFKVFRHSIYGDALDQLRKMAC